VKRPPLRRWHQSQGADHSDRTDEAYPYDADGNRTSTGYTVGTNNRTTTDGVYDYACDDEGNRSRKTTVATGAYVDYAWGYRNRLTAVIYKASARCHALTPPPWTRIHVRRPLRQVSMLLCAAAASGDTPPKGATDEPCARVAGAGPQGRPGTSDIGDAPHPVATGGSAQRAESRSDRKPVSRARPPLVRKLFSESPKKPLTTTSPRPSSPHPQPPPRLPFTHIFLDPS